MEARGYAPENIPGGVRDTGGKIVKFNNSGKSSRLSEWFTGSYLVLPSGDHVFRIGYGSWSRVTEDGRPEKFSNTIELKNGVKAEHRECPANGWREEQEKVHRNAANKTKYIFERYARRVLSHPYLERKGVATVMGSLDVKANDSGSLLVPVRNIWSGDWMGMQYISSHADGGKFFAKGMSPAGGCFTIGFPVKRSIILITEGLATGCSLFMATGLPVVVAFAASNLKEVALGVRSYFPSAKMIFAGDDDSMKWGEGVDRTRKINVGKEAAEAAAKAVGGVAVFPVFPKGVRDLTDFNDLYVHSGADAVWKLIDEAIRMECSVKEGGIKQK